jgi:hypothetical protein
MTMARRARTTSAESKTAEGVTPRAGTVRACELYRGELARHRVIAADGADYVVATVDERRRNQAYVTAAYPVLRGYLVMMRQPLCALSSADETAAREQHNLLIRALTQGGTGVVKARRRSAALRRAERTVTTPSATEISLEPADLMPAPPPEHASAESAGLS